MLQTKFIFEIKRLMKNYIKRFFLVFGFEITRITSFKEASCRYENFKDLSEAYEFLLNKLGADNRVPQNNIRPMLLAQLTGSPPPKAYFIIEALAKTKILDGDVCEFGVADGATSALIANEILQTDKKLHLFDSFEGLPEPSEKDNLKNDIFSLGNMEAYAGKMSYPEDRVLTRLKAISFPQSRRVIHKGFIEKIIMDEDALPGRISFAFVDFDFYTPIKTTLNYLHNVTLIGAIVIVDDYDYFSTGVKTAVEEFINDKDPDHSIYDVFIPDKRFTCIAVLTKKR